jgi:hypothetical protein
MADPGVLGTNVNDDFPRSVCDETEDRLWKRLSCGKWSLTPNITYLRVGGPEAGYPRPPFKPLLFCLLWSTKRSRIRDVAKVLV